MAVGDDLGAVRETELLPYLLLRGEQHLLDRKAHRTRDVPLSRIAHAAERSFVLLESAHVEDGYFSEPGTQLGEVDVGHASPRTSSSSAATAGRSSSCSSHASSRTGSVTP